MAETTPPQSKKVAGVTSPQRQFKEGKWYGSIGRENKTYIFNGENDGWAKNPPDWAKEVPGLLERMKGFHSFAIKGPIGGRRGGLVGEQLSGFRLEGDSVIVRYQVTNLPDETWNITVVSADELMLTDQRGDQLSLKRSGAKRQPFPGYKPLQGDQAFLYGEWRANKPGQRYEGFAFGDPGDHWMDPSGARSPEIRERMKNYRAVILVFGGGMGNSAETAGFLIEGDALSFRRTNGSAPDDRWRIKTLSATELVLTNEGGDSYSFAKTKNLLSTGKK